MDTVHKTLARRLSLHPPRRHRRPAAWWSRQICWSTRRAGGLVTMLRKGVLPNAVLALIARRPRYGLEIVRTLREAGLVNGEGTVYPILARLREEGLVTTEWQEAVAGPPRRYYAATGDGLQQRAAFRRAWLAFVATVEEILEEAGPRSTARTP